MIDWHRVEDPVDRLHGFLSGYHATGYVYTGVECGLFAALVEPRTPDDLAAALDLHDPYVRRFCEVGLRWGLLEAVDPGDTGSGAEVRFRLREEFVDYLADESATGYMGDVFRFAATYLGEDYADYPAYFRSGGTRTVADRDPGFAEIIERTTRGLRVVFAEKLVPESLDAFEARLASGRLLDVGCGSGHLACHLAEKYPGLEVLGVDVDRNAIRRATDRAAEEGMSDRTTFRVQDAAALAADEPFDASVLFMSLHEIPPAKRAAAFERLDAALGPDGVIVVFDEVYPDAPEAFRERPYVGGAETQWSELPWGTDVLTEEEQRDLFAAAGFEERARLTFADRFVVYEGVRP